MNKTTATSIALSSAAIAGALLFFQNCSNVNLVPVYAERESVAEVEESLNFKAEFCPDIKELESGNSKFIFVLDMSISNIGDWYRDQSSHLNPKPSYFDPSLATDKDGDRFKAIRSFIQTCGSKMGSAFSIIGFGTSAGRIANSGGQRQYSCDNMSFKNATQALADLGDLEQAQQQETPWFLQWDKSRGKYLTDPNFPPILGATSYSSGLECAKSVLNQDLLSPESVNTQNYYLYFISDGRPMDKSGTGCNTSGISDSDSQSCHMDKILDLTGYMRQVAFSRAKDIRIHSVFYGSQTPPDVMNAIAIEGGTSTVFKLDSFSDNNNVFCQILGSNLNVELRPDSISFFNISTVLRQGIVEADSDLDGVSDKDELRMGWDPTRPRSLGVSGVLDGICFRLGGREACLERRQNTSCLPNLYNKWGLTDCDIKMLELSTSAGSDWGVDSDLDGMPDFIEVLRGTNPAIADMDDDPDGDGFTNLQEIIQGTDPRYTDSNLNPGLLNSYSLSPTNTTDSSCLVGSWTLNIEKLQKASTIPASMNSNLWFNENLSHGDQILLVNFRSSPYNDTATEFLYFGQKVKLTKTPAGYLTLPHSTPKTLAPSDFIEVGKVKP